MARIRGLIAITAFAGILGIGGGLAQGQENASNPLAAVSSVDPRLQYFDLGDANQTEAWIDGAHMATPKLKLRYEIHYVTTNVTGSTRERLGVVPLQADLLSQEGHPGAPGTTPWLSASSGFVTFDTTDRGIGCGRPPPGDFQCRPMVGSGSDQLAPFAAVSLVKGGLVVVPLVQHFVEYER